MQRISLVDVSRHVRNNTVTVSHVSWGNDGRLVCACVLLPYRFVYMFGVIQNEKLYVDERIHNRHREYIKQRHDKKING